MAHRMISHRSLGEGRNGLDTGGGAGRGQGASRDGPIHQALFNVKTGEVVAPPAYDPVKTFPCRIEGDDVLVDI
jgi:hypothetical protein